MSRRIITPSILFAVIGIASISLGTLPPRLSIPESDIKFSHDLHVTQQEIECNACHAAVMASTSSADKNLPTMDECGACHDVENDKECGFCHKNPEEPMAFINPERELIFSHRKHLDMKTGCDVCHQNVGTGKEPDPAYLPAMKICFGCHNGIRADNECALCHSGHPTLLDIHPVDWRHQHGDQASANPDWCGNCHVDQHSCIQCHRGDNLTGNIHDLNYVYTHGLDAKSGDADCARCHDNRAFCVDCHERGNRMPLRHSSMSWGADHGRYAREDVENCASCHEAGDPTCARAGCHNDFDGIRGTDNRIHGSSAPQFDIHGPWHDDDSYYCFQCHVTTRAAGAGFCGYCHGGGD